MAKSREKKEAEVKDLQTRLAKSKAAVFASQKGVSVRDINALRRELKQQNGELQAIKKTLLVRAFSQAGRPLDANLLTGTLAVAFSFGDEIAAAKTIQNFSKKNEGMVILGGLLDQNFVDAATVKRLAMLPGKQELLGQLVRTIQAPVSGFVNVLAANLRGLVQVLQAIKQSKT